MNYIHQLKFTEEVVTSTHTEEDGTIVEMSFTKDSKQVAEEVLRSVNSSLIRTIAHVGTITKPAVYDPEGNEVSPAEVIEGYHVDVLAKEPIPELIPYCLETKPNTPVHGYGWAKPDFIIVTKTFNQ